MWKMNFENDGIFLSNFKMSKPIFKVQFTSKYLRSLYPRGTAEVKSLSCPKIAIQLILSLLNIYN